MNVTRRRVYRSLGRNFSCLFTWKEAWKQTDRPELWSVLVGAVPHIPVLSAEHQENTTVDGVNLFSYGLFHCVSKNEWLPCIAGEGCMILFFFIFIFLKGALELRRGGKQFLVWGIFLELVRFMLQCCYWVTSEGGERSAFLSLVTSLWG